MVNEIKFMEFEILPYGLSNIKRKETVCTVYKVETTLPSRF